jgi:hypothetical protein
MKKLSTEGNFLHIRHPKLPLILLMKVSSQTTGLDVDPGRQLTWVAQTFANTTAYASYVLTFPTVRNSATANSMQVGEITFDGVVPEPGTTALTGGVALLGLVRRRRK